MLAEKTANTAEKRLSRDLRRNVAGLTVWAFLGRFARLLSLLGLAGLAAGVVVADRLPVSSLLLLLIGASASAGLMLVVRLKTEALEKQSASTVIDWFERLFAKGSVRSIEEMDPGDLVSRLSRQPSSAASYLVSVTISKRMTAGGAVLALLLMALFSWPAALLLALAMPVMVVFFAFVGALTKEQATIQEEALQSLSAGFADRVRCLPTIVACHAVDNQGRRLDRDLQSYRNASNAVLKTAFLNAGVLDFFSSLSIAMLAVFLGLGLLGLPTMPGFGGLGLTASLSVLVLAPEVFQPLRQYAELYHKAAEGKAALQSLNSVAEAEVATDRRLPLNHIGTRDVVLHHGLAVADFDLPERGVVAIVGSSGIGKTSLLRALMGVDIAAGQVFKTSADVAWASSDAWLPNGTLREIFGPRYEELLGQLLLTDEPRLRSKSTRIVDHGAEYSGGQRLRLALARAAISNAAIVCADEPTAKLDPNSADAVRRILKEQSLDRLVLVVTHDPVMMEMADRQIALGTSEVAA